MEVIMSVIESFVLEEDTDCEYCGYPMFKGETAQWFEGEIAGVFCGGRCAYKEERANTDRVLARLAAYARPDLNPQHLVTEVIHV
jgi:hypothetical protein